VSKADGSDVDARLRAAERLTFAIAANADEDPDTALEEIGGLALAFREAPPVSPDAPLVLINMTSVLINIASDLADEEALSFAVDTLDELLGSPPSDAEWTAQATYNRATARDLLVQTRTHRVGSKADEDRRRDAIYQARAVERASLRAARRDFRSAAGAADADQATRALTNLGNTLSTSGRWLEAYEQYTEAVAVDPTNGNAAGNAAYSLLHVLQAELGPAGHLAAVYGKYRDLAQANRARTVELAGEATAEKWDAELPEIPTQGHLAHAASDDPFVRWVARERLALTPVMDGLGSDNARFDDVAIESVTTGISEPDMPQIFASANVLKADYLAARSTVYRGLTMLDDSADGWALHAQDTGTYADTLDYATYGESISSLTLGWRAALDVLDKIAVATNEYLGTGDDAGKVNFRTYWFAKKKGKPDPAAGLRAELLDGRTDVLRALALAELADDLDDGGLYEHAQAVRNRSTHRLVRAKLFDAEGVTNTALSTLDVSELRRGSVQALRVARSALLYFHALVTVTERRKGDGANGVHLPLFMPPFQ
jgi:tetratricopeptide (TPR) repeat protein